MLQIRTTTIFAILVLQLILNVIIVSSVPLVTDQKSGESETEEEDDASKTAEVQDYTVVTWPYRPKCKNPCRAICMTPTSDENLCCDNCYCDYGLRLCHPLDAKSNGDDDDDNSSDDK